MKVILLMLILSPITFATDYHIGPNQALSTISEAPWASLNAGDRVFIHWREQAYKETSRTSDSELNPAIPKVPIFAKPPAIQCSGFRSF